MLPRLDMEFLARRALPHEVVNDSGMICVILKQWPLPPGYHVAQADLLLRLQPGYPDLQPDMWWLDPALHTPSGQPIEATQLTETYLGRQWQRWSRHLQPGQWRSGVDGLESYVALIDRELNRYAAAAA